jgi:hypothetical protein
MINRSTTHRELRTIAGGIAAGVGCPYLALRFGVPDPEVPPPPAHAAVARGGNDRSA